MDNAQILCSLRKFKDREEKQREVEQYFSMHGNYHKKLKVIHVTGTAGKGSVCNMIAQTLTNAGYKVGLLTSPHNIKVNERFKINNEPISDEDLNSYLQFFFDTVPDLSFNMYITLVATKYFYDNDIDFFVCEVFVGGRYDTTNIYDNIATVITSIGIDHTRFLGDTIEKILYDKVGIIRKDVPLFTRVRNKVIDEEVLKIGAKLVTIDDRVNTNLVGEHQRENAGLAFRVLDYLGIDHKIIRSSLMNIDHPGRSHYLAKNILLDSAHNEIGFERLFDYILGLKFNKLYILFSMAGEKEIDTYLKFLDKADLVVYTMPSMFKVKDPNEYSPFSSKIILDVNEAYNFLKNKLEEDDLLVICGSIFLGGEILSLEENKK